ncbi:hypothetical protein AKJ16_DCAP11998 [Drosera capensis]
MVSSFSFSYFFAKEVKTPRRQLFASAVHCFLLNGAPRPIQIPFSTYREKSTKRLKEDHFAPLVVTRVFVLVISRSRIFLGTSCWTVRACINPVKVLNEQDVPCD